MSSLKYRNLVLNKRLILTFQINTYVSSCIRLVSIIASVETADEGAPDEGAGLFSPFSFVLFSDLCDPEDEDGRSDSSGFGCIRVKGNSATNSLKKDKNIDMVYISFKFNLPS